MSESYGIEKLAAGDIEIFGADISYSVVTGEEIVCFCFNEEDARKIMYALNRREQPTKRSADNG